MPGRRIRSLLTLQSASRIGTISLRKIYRYRGAGRYRSLLEDLAEGITMFWFISPWEAARISLEAQRRVMALPWLYFASGRGQEGLSEGEKPPPRRHRYRRGPWLVHVQEQSPPAKLRKLSRSVLAVVGGKTRGLEERTRSVRTELIPARAAQTDSAWRTPLQIFTARNVLRMNGHKAIRAVSLLSEASSGAD